MSISAAVISDGVVKAELSADITGGGCTPTSGSLATEKAAVAVDLEIRTEIEAVRQAIDNFPLGVKPIENSVVFEFVDNGSRNNFCVGIGLQAIPSGQEDQIPFVIKGFSERVFP